MDEYREKYAIVSDKEAKTILKYWDDFQDKNEMQFEIDYMNSTQRDRGFRDETANEETEEFE